MAPARGPGGKEVLIHEIDRTDEYTKFIQDLTAFHEKRGTAFDPEPRLPTMHGHVNVDLFKLYKAVVDKGGYDELNKVQKAWGALASELGMYFTDNKGMGQLSFQLKQDFYRYLSAYWVQDKYGRDPPPKEILEQQSCASKHGPVLSRTLENFKFSMRRAEETPTRDERPPDGTPTSGNRASGRLREAPPQRVPFQPDTAPSRQRNVSSHHNTPNSNMTQNNYHGNHTPQNHHHLPQQHNPNNPLHVIQAQQAALRGASSSFTPGNSEIASRLGDPIEPRPPISVPLRPVNTPGNNPVEFAKRQRLLKAQAAALGNTQVQARPIQPPAGFDGPNIYTRCLQALRSGIPAEQAFALNHLVKISYERGDKYKFDSFLGLAEGLIEKALEVGNLFYDVDWRISYSGEQDSSNPAVLDGLDGTSDILERIQSLKPKAVLDHLQPADFSDRLLRITEAVLTMRNMVMLIENAVYMAEVYPLKDVLCIILHLPDLEMLVEIKHFALDIAEQVTPWLLLNSSDPLYRTLLAQLNSTDRGTILTALRAISRISMNLEATNKLENVPVGVLQNINNWLLLNDEELMDACLDFLYQYTAVVANVESLLGAVNMENLVPHLVRLLAHGAKRVREDKILEPEKKALCTEEVPPLPFDLHEQLRNTDEPTRCFSWLKTLFEEDAESHITQIAIWQAYQGSFGALAGVRSNLSAADFIRNVSHVFQHARAQIIRGPGEVQRFIIEGIRARTVPCHYETKEDYARCQWQIVKGAVEKRCNQFYLGGEQMWRHTLTAHLGITIDENGKVGNKEVTTSCDWAGCVRYPTSRPLKLVELTRHIKTHFPAPQKRSQQDGPELASKRPRKSYITPAKTMSLTWEKTMVTSDERKPNVEQAAGIPLSAVLVLRNIARNIVKTESEEELLKQDEMGGESGGWNEKLFRPVMTRLFEVMTENKALADYITSLLQLVQTDD
ncbi:arid/bright DNA binding domain-containing protein [Xylaria bambusicola]|uniref:arid/bright DNA binding domain-containing protein n=1 Tax=Xylaria bambusicola TaxID=326684 RepID=UPI00200850F5|nr:arid/bright DNA binding domain-containing protein [Xylaria bambusicola]KAI0503081.1 arid/bright DNA binding domain-containing protein [Xylaria bambusicola]